MALDAVSIENNVLQDFQKLYDELESNKDVTIISSYFGDLAEGLTYILTNKLEKILETEGVKKTIVRRIFSIVIEGLQNIRLHGEYDDEGQKLASFILWEKDGQFSMRFTNLIDQGDKMLISGIIQGLNKMDKVALKQHYIRVMNEGVMSKAGGAGLGLITMAMKSKSDIEFHFKDVQLDLSIFTLELTLD